jgi:hypothetical protein
MDGLLKLTGLWLRTSERTGKPVMSGRLGGAKIVILENRDRRSDDDPSHILFLSEPSAAPGDRRRVGNAAPRDRAARQGAQRLYEPQGNHVGRHRPERATVANDFFDDEIP